MPTGNANTKSFNVQAALRQNGNFAPFRLPLKPLKTRLGGVSGPSVGILGRLGNLLGGLGASGVPGQTSRNFSEGPGGSLSAVFVAS